MTDLVACYWTVAGPVDIHYGREWSMFSWEDRCAQAASHGFTGLGLWMADIDHQLESTTVAEMVAVFSGAGLKHLELEFIADFFREPGTPERAESDRVRRLLLDCAAQFGAHHIKVGNIPGVDCDLARLGEAYAEICADAAKVTDAKVGYEIIPVDPNIQTLDHGLEMLHHAGEPHNGGLIIDTWHMSKLGILPTELRERLKPDQVVWVELSDGQFANMEDQLAEVTRFRSLPGEGEFDIPGYIDALATIYPGPWGVEVLSEALRALPIEEGFRRAYETTAAQFQVSGKS
jgi:sugar phosphate isomerase/epimerase